MRRTDERVGMPDFDPDDINLAAFDYYSRLQRVREHILEHLGDPIGLQEAAEVACLSPAYFSAFFHEKTGVRFHEWHNYLRIERAKRLLEEHNHPITTLGYALGFQDLRTFERTFKRCVGKTPSDFKKSVRPS